MVILTCGGWGEVGAAGEAVAAANALNNGLEPNAARQLRIYRDALFSGASEQSRDDAAVELLLRDDKASREILLKALLSKDNGAARQAVCRGLISSRALGAVVRNRNDFREGLVGILVDEGGLDAQLAAEAMLVFKYREISGRLEKLVRSGEIERRIRLNVVYALKIRPDKEAMSELIRLLDDGDVEIAGAAESALQDSFGIPVGTAKEVWGKILKDLQRKSPNEIRRERLLQQETRMRKLQGELVLWRRLYLAGLDKEYEGIDEAARGVLLFERLGSELTAVKLWALDKVSRRSAGTALPAEFGPRLVGLISDADRVVRLETARVLSKMSDLNPARELLGQFGVEKYEDVRLAIFEALGEACYYAFSPGSEIELGDEVRNETLELAAGYIIETDGSKAKKGAEVIRKLLELGGLDAALAQKYLELVAGRYEQAKSEEGPLRGELLGVMATLCGRGSYYREASAKLFEKAFVEGLGVEADSSVREAAVAGLMNIDGANALRVFKEQGLADDESSTVRETVIKLAGRVGKEEDVEWLAAKVDSNVEGQSLRPGSGQVAQEAIGAILGRQKAAVVAEWAEQLAWDGAGGEQVRSLFEIAEKKAEVEKAVEVLLVAREALVGIYLEGNDAEQVGRVIAAWLGEQDMGAEDALAKQINAYLSSEEVDPAAKESLVGVLEGIETAEEAGERPKWAEQVKIWRESL
jgi:HEAT repeat protein